MNLKRQPGSSMVIDVSGLLFRVAAVQKSPSNAYARGGSDEELVGLTAHASIMSIFKYFNKLKPDFVVFAFEGGNLWRKEFTAEQRTALQYKANRVRDPGMAHFYEMIDAFKATISAHTSICCLEVPGMEGDDVIAAYCQLYASDDHKITIVSGDRDFIQLLKLPGVSLLDPGSGKYRNQPGDKDYAQDLDLWLFEKCIRGDMGDYVPSAYPRVRSTKIKEAFESDYVRVNFMNERWVDPTGVERRVGDLFLQNVALLNLYEQPEPYRTTLLEAVIRQVEDRSAKYSHFHFLRFLDKFKLVKLQQSAIKYVDLFANNQRFLNGEDLTKVNPHTTKKVEKDDDSDGGIADIIITKGPKLVEF